MSPLCQNIQRFNEINAAVCPMPAPMHPQATLLGASSLLVWRQNDASIPKPKIP
jgi:hypothetical protein